MERTLISGPPKPGEPEYVVTPNGVYLWHDNPFVRGWTKCDDIEQLCRYAEDDREVDTSIVWRAAKIPLELFCTILGTIQHGPREEVGFVLYYRTNDRKWFAVVPKQAGSACHVEFDGAVRDDGFVACGSVHTHPNIGARWSHQDIDNHETWCGLHFVVSTQTREKSKVHYIKDILATVFVPGAHFDVPLSSVVSGWNDDCKLAAVEFDGCKEWLKTLQAGQRKRRKEMKKCTGSMFWD